MSEETAARPSYLGIVCAAIIAALLIGTAIFGAVRRAGQEPVAPDFSGLVVSLPNGVDVTLTEARVECVLPSTAGQSVLARLTATGEKATDGLQPELTIEVAAAGYNRERTISLPHVRDADDPRYAEVSLTLPTEQYLSTEGAAGGTLKIQATCDSSPSFEVISEAQLADQSDAKVGLAGSLKAKRS
jgi:hypothetical protein